MPAMDENVIKRIMPHSLEAEQSVIGSMFIDAEARADLRRGFLQQAVRCGI